MIRSRQGSSRLRKGIVAAVSVLLLAGGVMLMFVGKTRKPPVEVERSSLISKNAKLYRKGSDVPFSGIMLEHYPSGALQSRSEILGGLLNGVSIGYYTNGQAQVEEHFKAGVSDGLRRKWYASGAKLSDVMIFSGKLSGTFRRWHENGMLAEEVQMTDGVPDGRSVSYYPSGFMKVEAILEHGKMIRQRTWKDGAGERRASNVAQSSG